MKNIILASTSTLFGDTYLNYLKEEVTELFNGIDEIIFIPFARPGGISHDEYTETAVKFFRTFSIKVIGLHKFENQIEAIQNAKGFFTGGGNTFVLLKELHERNLLNVLKSEIEKGKPYLGTSAGSNIAGVNIKTTNDMPITYPPSFDAMGLIPFNLNPHYLDPDINSTHNGETRETRIKEFHSQNNIPVVGLREGSWLSIKGEQVSLEGKLTARIFEQDKNPYELSSGMIIDFK